MFRYREFRVVKYIELNSLTDTIKKLESIKKLAE